MNNHSSTVLDKEDLRQTVADVLDVPVPSVTDDAHFVEDLGVDSLMALEVMVVLEKKYGIKLDESELNSITSLSRAYAMLQKNLAAAS